MYTRSVAQGGTLLCWTVNIVLRCVYGPEDGGLLATSSAPHVSAAPCLQFRPSSAQEPLAAPLMQCLHAQLWTDQRVCAWHHTRTLDHTRTALAPLTSPPVLQPPRPRLRSQTRTVAPSVTGAAQVSEAETLSRSPPSHNLVGPDSAAPSTTSTVAMQAPARPGYKSGVCIVGAGPGGLAAALALAKRGWTDITVLEARADYATSVDSERGYV